MTDVLCRCNIAPRSCYCDMINARVMSSDRIHHKLSEMVWDKHRLHLSPTAIAVDEGNQEDTVAEPQDVGGFELKEF